jgi:2-keto-4-pentenoate hydratase/2-oxohepta-3-ene-1,7-dioic acid hydratase in catechol pathway
MAPPEVRLLDYEVELGFVALEDIDLGAIPSATDLDGRVAYFLANDVTDREPVARGDAVAGKGRAGFLPMGPWMVHGDDLRPFSSGCPRSLRMRLSVREGEHASLRQDSETALMINDARAILETLAAAIDPDEPGGTRSHLGLRVDGRERFYPLALMARGRPVLPKGSIVLTGTPGGTAMHAPATLPLLGRALFSFQRPSERFIEEQVANRAAEGYLGDGDVVVAAIDELGTQWWKARWGRAGSADPCDQALPFLR